MPGRARARSGRCRADFREPALRLEQEAEERELCDGRAEQQILGRSQQGEERDTEEAAEQEPDRESAHDPRKALLHLPHIQEPARLSADEHEADLERDREQDQEARRDPDPAGEENQPGRDVEDGEGREAHRGDAAKSRSARRPGYEDGRAGAEDGDSDVGRGSHFARMRPGRARSRGSPRARASRRTRAPAPSAARRRRAGACRSRGLVGESVVARRRDTSSAMTPWASSGESIKSSSSTGLSTRSTEGGSSAVTDAARGAGISTASSPTCARAELDQRPIPAMHLDASFDESSRCASTAPSSMSTSPVAMRFSTARSATAASTRPGMPANTRRGARRQPGRRVRAIPPTPARRRHGRET